MTIMNEPLKHENELKSSHLRMLIRIRNILTEDQIEKLKELNQVHYVPFPVRSEAPMPPNAIFFRKIQGK